ncbi:MAG TPA: hypothetical protein VF228_01035 [Iamia sp.]
MMRFVPTRRRLPEAAVTTAPLRISCSDCSLEHTAACDDCVVTFILRRAPDDAVVVDVEELRAIRALSAGGLVPRLRHTG